jgi:hypothetical protein
MHLARIKREQAPQPKAGRRSDKEEVEDIVDEIEAHAEVSDETETPAESVPEGLPEQPVEKAKSRKVLIGFVALLIVIVAIVGTMLLKQAQEQTELRKASIYLDQSMKKESIKEASISKSKSESASASESVSVSKSIVESVSESKKESESIETSKSVSASISESIALAPAEYTISNLTSNGHVKLIQFKTDKYASLNAQIKSFADDQAEQDSAARNMTTTMDTSSWGMTATPEVVYNQDQKVSVLYSYYWYAGGVGNSGAKTFNAINGQPVTIREMFLNDAAYRSANSRLWNQIEAEGITYPTISQSDEDVQLENAAAAYWKDGGLVVWFDEYVLGSGAEGAKDYFIADISDLLK